jgi:dipeptidase E
MDGLTELASPGIRGGRGRSPSPSTRPFLIGPSATTSAATSDEFSVIGESLPRTDPYTPGRFSPCSNDSGGSMKLLLTSAGIKNTSINDALVDLLGKPISESSALCIPTAMYGHPHVGPGAGVWRFISGQEPETPMCELSWKSLGVLELTALPSIDEERWVPLVKETDVLLASGGDALYLCHWMRQSGLADLLPSLDETVWAGMSAGSMVMTPRIGDDFVGWKPPTGGDETVGIVDFSIFPHLDNEDLPWNTMANAERWAAGLSGPAYAIDDQTAIKVTDGTVEVVSEGHWKLFTPSPVRESR